MKMMRTLGAVLALSLAGSAGAANFCGELKNAFGPFDYRQRGANADSFYLVEMAHFTSDVENGVKGNTAQIGGDLDYTLRAIPNHHRALATMARLSRNGKVLVVPGAKYPVECYFERAIRFTPDDGSVRSAYGSYLYSLGKNDQAMQMFRQGADLEPENPSVNYNLGLAYFNKKDYDNAAIYAKKAYALGFPLPGLKTKLQGVGKWNETAP
jgi:Flp pilus assembly protein TadD